MGPALSAARLAMLAARIGGIEEICQRPLIKQIIEPNLNHSSQYRDGQKRYQKLYRKLKEEFDTTLILGFQVWVILS